MNVQQDDQNQTMERKNSGLATIDLSKTRTPIGSFAGSQDFLIRMRNGKLVAADTGDQGGGQN
jgi:hypothetical protein